MLYSAQLFKIQFGQIYSLTFSHNVKCHKYFKIQFGQIYSKFVFCSRQNFLPLKSSLDRFIVIIQTGRTVQQYSLKSSLDRFIGYSIRQNRYSSNPLKSSLDRFIVRVLMVIILVIRIFKIQFGQIYRKHISNIRFSRYVFKIQFGQIYSKSPGTKSEKRNPLKSSLDRFIGECVEQAKKSLITFKIQFGQIYRSSCPSINPTCSIFKIQFGQIYRCSHFNDFII